MASFNWTAVSSAATSIAGVFSTLGIAPGSSAGSAVLASLGFSSNPNQSAEIALCKQIMTMSAMGAISNGAVEKLAETLATEQGIPVTAAALAMTLFQPGVNIVQTCLEIEQIINAG
jgi:hypothetical protein